MQSPKIIDRFGSSAPNPAGIGVREAIQRNKITAATAAIVLVLGAAIFIAAKHASQSRREPSPTASFYSDDDGSTYFVADIYHFPPFDHRGRVADRARVFSTGSQTFVGMLERYDPETKKLLLDAYAKVVSGEESRAMLLEMLGSSAVTDGIEYKLPGPGHEWSRTRPAITTPDGQDCILVMP
jgi:hypothetical protein